MIIYAYIYIKKSARVLRLFGRFGRFGACPGVRAMLCHYVSLPLFSVPCRAKIFCAKIFHAVPCHKSAGPWVRAVPRRPCTNIQLGGVLESAPFITLPTPIFGLRWITRALQTLQKYGGHFLGKKTALSNVVRS